MSIPLFYWRSSSLNSWSDCQQSYFLNYVLGINEAPKKNTDLGTIVHKCLEILALSKLSLQNTGKIEVDDEVGKFSCSLEDFLKPKKLSSSAISDIRKVQKIQYFADVPPIPDNLTRYGVDYVQEVIDKVYEYYTNIMIHDWGRVDKRNIEHQVWIALDYNNGEFDPRKNEIFASEQHFDIELPELDLRLKGTIDLILKEDGFLRVVDWKTGSRVSWSEESRPKKDYNRLQNDKQLMFYNFVLNKMMPNTDVCFTIFFIRDSGPFTLMFDYTHIEKMQKILEEQTELVRSTKTPKLKSNNQLHSRCQFCDYRKQPSRLDPNRNRCQFIRDEIQNIGVEQVIEKYQKKNFSTSTYKAPGEVST